MRLTVRHSTLYHFDVPMRFVTQSHRLTPVTNASQTVIDWSVSAEGAAFGAGFTDGAGDRISTMTAQGPVERVAVQVEGTVETTDTAGVLRNHREVISPRVYLQPTHATLANRALIDLKDAALEGGEVSELSRAHRLANAVSDAIAYVNSNARDMPAINAVNFCTQTGNDVRATVCSSGSPRAQRVS